MKFTNPIIRYRVRHGENMPDDLHSYTVEEWKYFAADICRSNFPVAEIDPYPRRKLHRTMVRIVCGQLADRRRANGSTQTNCRYSKASGVGY